MSGPRSEVQTEFDWREPSSRGPLLFGLPSWLVLLLGCFALPPLVTIAVEVVAGRPDSARQLVVKLLLPSLLIGLALILGGKLMTLVLRKQRRVCMNNSAIRVSVGSHEQVYKWSEVKDFKIIDTERHACLQLEGVAVADGSTACVRLMIGQGVDLDDLRQFILRKKSDG